MDGSASAERTVEEDQKMAWLFPSEVRLCVTISTRVDFGNTMLNLDFHIDHDNVDVFSDRRIYSKGQKSVRWRS